MSDSLFAFTLRTLEGDPLALERFAGKAALVVNVASKCGLTPQYAGLVALAHRQPELVVLGVPCNQFGGQEPGTREGIRAFCSTNYGVEFPLTEKLDVNGPNRHPLFAWLTSAQTEPDGPGDVRWNFTKFVIDRRGQVIARFPPTTAPDDPALVAAIDRALARS